MGISSVLSALTTKCLFLPPPSLWESATTVSHSCCIGTLPHDEGTFGLCTFLFDLEKRFAGTSVPSNLCGHALMFYMAKRKQKQKTNSNKIATLSFQFSYATVCYGITEEICDSATWVCVLNFFFILVFFLSCENFKLCSVIWHCYGLLNTKCILENIFCTWAENFVREPQNLRGHIGQNQRIWETNLLTQNCFLLLF